MAFRRTEIGIWRAALSALWVLLCLAGVAPAQQLVQQYSDLSRRGITAGLSKGVVTFSTPAGASDLEFVEADLGMPRLGVTVAMPLGGPNQAEGLESLARSVDGLSAFGIGLPPRAGSAEWLAGMRYADAALYSWPPADRMHLYIQAEGALALEIPARRPGVISFDDGTSLTLHSINGELPPPGAGASVYTGDLASDELPVAAWRGDPVIAVITPVDRGADPHRLFLASGNVNRQFRIDKIVPRDLMSTRGGESILVLTPPVEPEVLARLRGRPSLTVDVSLAPRDLLAKAILPAPRILMQDGEVYPDVDEGAAMIENALAFGPAGRRLLMITPSRERGRRRGTPLYRMRGFLRDRGYTTLLSMEESVSLLVSDLRGGADNREAANTGVIAAIVIRQDETTLSLPNVEGRLRRIPGLVAEGTGTEFPFNAPSRLTDGKLGIDTGLDQFWAAKFNRDFDEETATLTLTPNAVRFLLPEPLPVAAIDLIHAEAAGFSPEFSLKSFRILGRARRQEGSWKILATIDHEKPIERERLLLPDAGKLAEIRLEILQPSFLEQGDVMRLTEVMLWTADTEEK